MYFVGMGNVGRETVRALAEYADRFSSPVRVTWCPAMFRQAP